ncbi:alanine/glycine:cation symporter family protein [Larsenimonas salina]|uniref:alanine/glycine:cation symporter family protein n=1 Tax=Larsenimonas salina TaxID=1295565 RepID=UPI0020749D74|nr:sodium:alanine symporter family protein [Larsenimonas salina]MCM5703420.1 sodium:alanine symporter family protein [Larsenimonas salina]
MEQVTAIVNSINGVVWGPLMLLLLLGVGIFLQVGLKLMPVRKLGTGIRLLWGGRADSSDEGEISPFNALMTSLSATIGTGNIAGVATAIALGGPGAVFWMWVTALVGMATKYSEAVCAVKFRETDRNGNYVGGPMYYIKNGLADSGPIVSALAPVLAVLFAIFGTIASFGIGNTVQANSVADALNASFGIPSWLTGLVIMVLAGAVILGGLKRISTVAGRLVPLMAVFYFVAGLVILVINANEVIPALSLIISHAFTPISAAGGFAGAAVVQAIRFGVARGVFSNEAGLGSAPIAHAAAKTRDPVRQGLVAMLGTFIDTIVVCTITALAIITSGQWLTGESGAALTSMAFRHALPGPGDYIVALALAVFAFTTILGWSYYGERCFQYLFGERACIVFRVIFVIALPIGAMAHLDFIWLLADTFNALMAIPNLIALLLLSPVVFRLTRDYFKNNG